MQTCISVKNTKIPVEYKGMHVVKCGMDYQTIHKCYTLRTIVTHLKS